MSSRDRVLFVDDEPNIRLTLPSVLARHGFEVTTAASVPAALREIQSSSFDVLLSDLNIGEEGDGFRIVSAMRSAQPRCVNVILTGYPALESAVQAIRSQVDDYLVKPADVDTIIQVLREKLAARRKQAV
jgi:DNA-binding NtrC family response regulator